MGRATAIGGAAKHLAAAALLTATAAAPAVTPPTGGALDPTPAATAHFAPLEARIDRASHALLGAPYRLGPLGEGAPPDADPRFRLDAFDCTTYVETVLALALAGVDAGAGAEEATLPWLDRVRYRGGAPTFETRRHLVEAQWIPQLVEEGLVSDVTRAIGGRATRKQALKLRPEPWARSRLAGDLGLPWSALPAGRHEIPYLPWSVLDHSDVLRALPGVAILSLVAAPVRDTPTVVTHQALLFRLGDDTLVVRHASTRHRRVVEEPLAALVARARARRSRDVLGVNVLAIAPGGWTADP